MGEPKKNTPEIITGEEKYHFLFEHLFDAAFLVDVETGVIQETNIQATVLLKKSREEIVGMHFVDLHPVDKIEEYRKQFTRHVKPGRSADFDGEIIAKDGTITPVNVTSCNLSVNGRHLILGIFHEIARRKKAEEALKQSTTIYRDLFRTADVAILVGNLNGKITTANQTARTVSGYSMKELISLNISDILLIEKHLIKEEMDRLLTRHEVIRRRFELDVLRKDGIRVPVESVMQLIVQDGQPTGFHIMFRDITQQKRQKENMQFYISQIIKAQEEERKRIARDLHDETAQSLATIALRIQAIATIDVKLPEEVRKSLEDLRVRTSAVQDQVRRFSHDLRPDVLDHLGLIPALRALTGELEEKKINSHVEVIGNERRLSGEAELALFRIAQEAFNNIKKHSQASEATLKINFTPKKVKLNIIDNGKGFKLPEMAGDFARRGKLGLIGIQERVRLLNGNFSLISHEGKGTILLVEVTI
jgi:two-component system, NarL family, sensor histidine kinase DegS